jgi:hypothetical protein
VNEAVPDRIGIDHDDRAMLALIQASQLVGAHLALQTSLFHRVFEG